MIIDTTEKKRARAAKINEAKSIIEKAQTENRAMTSEEITAHGETLKFVDAMKVEIEAIEKQNALEMEMGGGSTQNAQNVKVVKDAGDQPWTSFGEQLVAAKKASDCKYRDIDPRLMRGAASGMNESIGSEGGFLVDKDFIPGLMMKTYETGEILSKVNKMQVSGNGIKLNYVKETSRATGSRFGGVQAYWEGEADTATSKKPVFGKYEQELKKLIAICYTTQELLDDSVALESYIKMMFAQEMSFSVEDTIINGTGAGQPLGVLSAACLVEVAKETNQAADTIKYENVSKMWSRMWAPSRKNAVWLINQDCEPQLQSMAVVVGTGGIPVYMPAGGLSQSPYSSLFGRPIIPVEYCQTVGDKGDIILGDFSQYMMIDKGGTRSDVSAHVRFLYDEQTFRFIYRADGAPSPAWVNKLTPKNGSNTLSPFVALAARA